MKIYNKKGLLLGFFWMVLALWSIIHDFGSPNPNTLVQIRDSVLSVFLLLMGVTAFWRAFSKKATKEDILEEQDERNCWIKYKSQSRVLNIAYGILFVCMVFGMIGFKMTAHMVWFSLFVIPGFLLGLFLVIEIFVKLYYEKHE